MTLILHGIRNCDTVKRARAWLGERGIDHRFRDFKTEAPSEAELCRWCEAVGWDTLLNRAGTTFRKLSEAERADLSQSKAIALMLAHPGLIKRPVTERDGAIHVGFKPDAFERAFG